MASLSAVKRRRMEDFPRVCVQRPGSSPAVKRRRTEEISRLVYVQRKGLGPPMAVKKQRVEDCSLVPVQRKGPPDMVRFKRALKDMKSKVDMVKITLKFFDQYRRWLVQQGMSGRLDLEARTFMTKHGLTLNQEKRSGAVPGVEVGQKFYYRWELPIVGMHFSPQGGIDTRPDGKSIVATSIIVSGGYEDDVDDGDELQYTGQGGNDYARTKKQEADQKLVRGNKAMELARKRGYPIRVVRGVADEGSPSTKAYTYGGLYKIYRSVNKPGLSGHLVWTFYLRRIPGQAPLQTQTVRFLPVKRGGLGSRRGLLLPDVTKGQDMFPVPVVNDLTKDDSLPPVFTCCSVMRYPEKPRRSSSGCACDHTLCQGSQACGCRAKNGGEWPYTPEGTLVRAQPVVFECGASCKCNPKTCPNRVTQKGGKFRLEVFKTKMTGWGLRSWDSIPPGSFICEFTGEIIDSDEALRRELDDQYMFSLDYGSGSANRWGTQFETMTVADSWRGTKEKDWFIDAKKSGSVARFINHSCSPNIYAQCVLYDHGDLRFPHIMLFASESIPAFTELTLDYGYTPGSIVDANGCERVQKCFCQSSNCKGRLY